MKSEYLCFNTTVGFRFLGGCCNGLLYLCKYREFHLATTGKLTLPFPVNLGYNKHMVAVIRSRANNCLEPIRLDARLKVFTAQVHVPGHMPLYGSKELEGLLVKVSVSDNCLENPDTFVAVMAHELSHVLLKSIRHPSRWNDEIFTNIVPVVLGLGRIIKEGRKAMILLVTLSPAL